MSDEVGIFRLIALELTGSIGMNADQIYNTDPVTGFMQEEGQVITIATGRLQTGVGLVHLPLFQPLPQLDEPNRIVVKGG